MGLERNLRFQRLSVELQSEVSAPNHSAALLSTSSQKLPSTNSNLVTSLPAQSNLADMAPRLTSGSSSALDTPPSGASGLVMSSPRIAVAGSLVADLCVWVPHFPLPDETLPASRFEMHPGGKGFNQALMAQRAGAEVSMIGRVGQDPFADPFFELMNTEGIRSSEVTRDPDSGTSLGIPMITPDGDNSIILISRANQRLSRSDIERAAPEIARSSALLLQGEVPIATSMAAAQEAREHDTLVLLNPAPAHPDFASLLADPAGGADWLIPNEIEASALLSQPISTPGQALNAARKLLEWKPRSGVIVTLGSQGAVCATGDDSWHARPFRIDPRDPTGAGDAFCGAFAFSLCVGRSPREALRFAMAAGALSATIPGATPSLPRSPAIEDLMARQPTGGTPE